MGISLSWWLENLWVCNSADKTVFMKRTGPEFSDSYRTVYSLTLWLTLPQWPQDLLERFINNHFEANSWHLFLLQNLNRKMAASDCVLMRTHIHLLDELEYKMYIKWVLKPKRVPMQPGVILATAWQMTDQTRKRFIQGIINYTKARLSIRQWQPVREGGWVCCLLLGSNASHQRVIWILEHITRFKFKIDVDTLDRFAISDWGNSLCHYCQPLESRKLAYYNKPVVLWRPRIQETITCGQKERNVNPLSRSPLRSSIFTTITQPTSGFFLEKTRMARQSMRILTLNTACI